MKKIFICLSVISFLFQFNTDAHSQNPTYELWARNFRKPAPDSIVFDIYLQHTNQGTANFIYAAGQYIFRFNPAIANGGSLTYKIITSNLPAEFVPVNPTISGTALRLSSNLPTLTNAPTISNTNPGTLVVRMYLKTSASSFDNTQSLALHWRNADDPPLYTKLFAFIGTTAVDITTGSTHFIDSTVIGINQISSLVPDKFSLSQNYPNPFNPNTNLEFGISKLGLVSLEVYNVTGQRVATLINETKSPGRYSVDFNGSNFSSGIYFYVLRAEEFVETKRMVLLK